MCDAICAPAKLIQAEGHSTVRAFYEPAPGSAVLHEIPSYTQGFVHQPHRDDRGHLFYLVSTDGEHVLGWVGSKNVKIESIEHRIRQSSMDTMSTDVGSCRLSMSSMESVDDVFDLGSFAPRVPYRGAGIERRYDIDMSEIARGGYGKVFKAADRQCQGRIVAIKKILGLEESMTAKYMKEANLMQDLDHPGICKLFEVYQDDDVLYMVLEYLQGGELFDKIVAEEKMSEETIADIIKQVACALKYAHSCGVAHRDLKPENICFCNQGTTQVKVIDWGLSSNFLKASMKSSVGSATYAGPEVAKAQGESDYTCACDLWSLGVLTYVMISGKPPFWGNPEKQLRMMEKEEYPMQNGEWLRASDSAKDFIRRLLKADPQKRMTVEEALSHEFLTRVPDDKAEWQDKHRVLSNMVTFCNAPRLFSLLVASAVRQLDHSNENTMRKVFNELDSKHDGALDFQEVWAALQSTFGEHSQEVCHIQHIFNKLDLDGRQRLTYTEFIAAAMEEDDRLQEMVIRLAFNAFDMQGETGKISEGDIRKLLARAAANESPPEAIFETMAREIMEVYDCNRDGVLDFEEFKRMMYSFAKPNAAHHNT